MCAIGFNSYITSVHSQSFFAPYAEKPPQRIKTVTLVHIRHCLNTSLGVGFMAWTWIGISLKSWIGCPNGSGKKNQIV